MPYHVDSHHDLRSKVLRSPLLNGLTLVTLLTIIIAVAYLASYYNNGTGMRSVTWYAPFDRCQPMREACTLPLGRHNPITLQLQQSGSGQLSLLVNAPSALDDTRFELVMIRREHSGDMHRILLERSPSGHAYHAEGLPMPCQLPDTRWRLSLVEYVPGERPIGTWYDISERCTPIVATSLHLFDSTVHS